MKGAVAILMVAALVALSLPAEAGVPTEQLKGATDQVLRILQDPEMRKPDKVSLLDLSACRSRSGSIRTGSSRGSR